MEQWDSIGRNGKGGNNSPKKIFHTVELQGERKGLPSPVFGEETRESHPRLLRKRKGERREGGRVGVPRKRGEDVFYEPITEPKAGSSYGPNAPITNAKTLYNYEKEKREKWGREQDAKERKNSPSLVAEKRKVKRESNFSL